MTSKNQLKLVSW